MILNAISKKLKTVYFQAVLDKHNTNGTTMHARTSWRKDSGKKKQFFELSIEHFMGKTNQNDIWHMIAHGKYAATVAVVD